MWAPAFPSRPAPPPHRRHGRPLVPQAPPPLRVTAPARSEERGGGRRGLTWRGNVRLGKGGPRFCPEVRPGAGVSRNSQPAVCPWRPPSARGNTLFLLPPGVSQLKPLKLQRSRPSWCLGNTGTNGTLDLLPRHWDTHDSGIPSPSSPRNIGSSRSSLQQKTQNEDPQPFPL